MSQSCKQTKQCETVVISRIFIFCNFRSHFAQCWLLINSVQAFFRFSLFQMLYSILPKFGTKYESAQAHCCGIDHKRQRIRVSFNLNSLIRNYTCLNDEFKGEYELAWDFALLVCFAKWHEKFVSWILLQIRTFFGRQSNSFSFLLFFL